jgi:hypothetical protein
VRADISRRMGYYAVMMRSEASLNGAGVQRLSGAGIHQFDDPLIEGSEITWNDEQWIVDEVDENHSTPPIVTLRRP